MMDDKADEPEELRDFTMHERSQYAWQKYNPTKLLNAINADPDDPTRLSSEHVVLVREAFLAGYEMGFIFKLTKEVTDKYNEEKDY